MKRNASRNLVALVITVGGSLAAAPEASAQLSVDYRDAVIGGNLTFVLRSNPGDVYLNVISLTEGPTCFPPSQPVGCIDVDLQFLWISFVVPGFYGTMPGAGEFDATFTAPNDPQLDGFVMRDQLIKVVNGKLAEKSNLVRILFSLTDEWHDSLGTIGNDRAWVPAVQLDDGRILFAGGGANGDECEVYIPWLQEFQPVASLNVPRILHTVTKLQSGKILVCGGLDFLNVVVTSSAELYDPVADQWSNVGPMGSIRAVHTANLLSDGRVLICGGSTDVNSIGSGIDGSNTALKTTELYDPALTTFSAGPNMSHPRTSITSVTLSNGDVLVASGWSFASVFGILIPYVLDTAQVFSPGSGTFGGEITMQAGRIAPGAVLMGSGKVLLAGGMGVSGTTLVDQLTAEVFDPVVPSFASVGNMSIGRMDVATLVLPASGKVLVAGGNTGLSRLFSFFPTDDVELYDPVLTTFTLAAPLALPRSSSGAIVLQNNLAAVFGGVGAVAPAALYRE